MFRIEATLAELAEIVKFLQDGTTPPVLIEKQNKILVMKVSLFTIMNGYLYKMGPGDVLRRCVLDHEKWAIVEEAHVGPQGGHYHANTTIRKNLKARLCWPKLNKDCRAIINKCESVKGWFNHSESMLCH